MQTVPLSEYLNTLPDREWLVGKVVYDKINDCTLYIKSVESGIWAGKKIDDDFGKNYSITDLLIQIPTK